MQHIKHLLVFKHFILFTIQFAVCWYVLSVAQYCNLKNPAAKETKVTYSTHYILIQLNCKKWLTGRTNLMSASLLFFVPLVISYIYPSFFPFSFLLPVTFDCSSLPLFPVCGCELAQGGFFVRQGEYICTLDYQRLYGTRCFSCQDFIEGEVVSALGKTYHPRCFVCTSCK